jgi:folylpolyglutamate synthase/dihydropteroate synthase
VHACRYGDVPLTVIFGAAADKNVSSMLKALTAHCCGATTTAGAITTAAASASASGAREDTASSLLLVTAKHPRAASAAQLTAAAAAASFTTADNSSEQQQQQQLVDLSVHEALLSALRSAGQHRVVLVCGSLVVAAEARAALFKHWPALFAAADWVHHAGEDTNTA